MIERSRGAILNVCFSGQGGEKEYIQLSSAPIKIEEDVRSIKGISKFGVGVEGIVEWGIIGEDHIMWLVRRME